MTRENDARPLDESLPPAQVASDAILYFLLRVQRDPDVRWLLLHTEALHRLCAAYAALTGKTTAQVKEAVEKDDETRGAKTRWERLEERIEQLSDRGRR